MPCVIELFKNKLFFSLKIHQNEERTFSKACVNIVAYCGTFGYLNTAILLSIDLFPRRLTLV